MTGGFRSPAERGRAHALLDALPLVALVVDGERRIRELNKAAGELLCQDPLELVGRRPGEALDCENSVRHPLGCGHAAACRDCLLRSSADETIRGKTSLQRQLRAATRGEREEGMILLLSASPLRVEDEDGALVCLQDVPALHRLRGLLPICSGCQKIRRKDEAWEAFIENHSHAHFTHGLCPNCMARFYPGTGRSR